jgi:hypothetical protein
MSNLYIVTCDVHIRKKYLVSDPSPKEAVTTTYGMVAHEYKEETLLDDSETLSIEVVSCKERKK